MSFAEAERAVQCRLMPFVAGGVTLRFGEDTVLDHLDLRLGQDGCTMLLGPNGAGKSLLLKVMHGLIDPDEGYATWAGCAAGDVTHVQSLVFQKPTLLRRSVAANIDFVLKTRGMDRGRLPWLLDHVGLAHKADQPARLLSGGEAQRLALARALAIEPEVLLLDEPTASLDPASVLAIERIVAQARDSGVRIVFVTHDVGQARRMADDVVFLFRGRVQEHRPATDFFRAPASQAARDYLDGNIVV
ncbi:ATP-binding cassette domain-containing protein [Roseivivax halodurans]|nr:ATP-binding cassette domain-containing protein [Roseivivax halodurans]